jgi:hypothetical protein
LLLRRGCERFCRRLEPRHHFAAEQLQRVAGELLRQAAVEEDEIESAALADARDLG